MSKKASYKKDLLNDLRKSRSYAALYLSAAFEDSQESFLIALRDVAEAETGVARVARLADMSLRSRV